MGGDRGFRLLAWDFSRKNPPQSRACDAQLEPSVGGNAGSLALALANTLTKRVDLSLFFIPHP